MNLFSVAKKILQQRKENVIEWIVVNIQIQLKPIIRNELNLLSMNIFLISFTLFSTFLVFETHIIST